MFKILKGIKNRAASAEKIIGFTKQECVNMGKKTQIYILKMKNRTLKFFLKIQVIDWTELKRELVSWETELIKFLRISAQCIKK